MDVYIAQCFTGGHCYGVYSDLEGAKLAIQYHAGILTGYKDIHLKMRWVDTFGSGLQWDWEANDKSLVDGPESVLGLMENPHVVRVTLDAALPFV